MQPYIPTPKELLFTFTHIALLSFGGALPISYRILVEDKRWLTAKDFADTLSLCQAIPGPNIVNLAASIGTRYAGILGAISALIGILALPIAIVILIAIAYHAYGEMPMIRHSITNLAAVVAGLFAATILKLLRPALKKRPVTTPLTVITTFSLINYFKLAIPLVFLLVLPFSLWAAWKKYD